MPRARGTQRGRSARERAGDEYSFIEKFKDLSHLIVKSKIVLPGKNVVIEFNPSKPGDYTYICLMSGHGNILIMQGVLHIKKDKRLTIKELKEAQEGNVNLYFNLVEPQSYVEQYDMIIEMLEWNTDATIELGMGEFNAWVRDRWDWQGAFLDGNMIYSTMATAKRATLGG